MPYRRAHFAVLTRRLREARRFIQISRGDANDARTDRVHINVARSQAQTGLLFSFPDISHPLFDFIRLARNIAR